LTFFGQNSVTFGIDVRFWRSFFKMQVISVAFRLAMFRFWGWKFELLGMPGRSSDQVFQHFFLENKRKLLTIWLALWSGAAGDFLVAQ
jgi:hypothetical protein